MLHGSLWNEASVVIVLTKWAFPAGIADCVSSSGDIPMQTSLGHLQTLANIPIPSPRFPRFTGS